MQKGFFKVTNITTSTSSLPVQVKTVIKGKGDPGYLLTSGTCLFFGPYKLTIDSSSLDKITSHDCRICVVFPPSFSFRIEEYE